MPTFVGPLTDGLPMYKPELVNSHGDHRLWMFFGNWAMVKTVWKGSDAQWHEGIYPYQGGDVHETWRKGVRTSVSEDTDPGSLANALVVYHGGHQYTISEAEAAELTAAGYGEYIT